MVDQPMNVIAPHHQQAITILTPVLRWSWIALLLTAILFELTPTPPATLLTTYGLVVLKSVGFALLGFLPPLAFQRLTTLVWSISIALGTSMGVEVLQAVVRHGHDFHWPELIAKALLIIGAFSLAIVARYDCMLSAGPLSIRLESAQLTTR